MADSKKEKEINKAEDTTEDLEADSVGEFYRNFNANFDKAIEKSPMGGFLLNQIHGGQKTVYSKTIRETKVFETSFLPILEQAYMSLSKIIKDPKKAIRYEQEVVPMEKAKKVNSDSVRHLASHTQFIKEIRDNGDIVPSKLLTTFAEDELGIYENRFVKTLINRVCKFLSLRIQILKKNIDSYETKSTTVTNNFKVDDSKVKVELSVKLERKLEAQVQTARDTYNKANNIYEMFKSLRASPLMQELKNYKEVVPPIMKTNIIMKNAEFKICYSTWVFLDRYTELAFDVNVKERKNPYTEELSGMIDKIMSFTTGTMLYNYGRNDLDPEDLPFKEFTNKKVKELSKIDDEYKFTPEAKKMEQFGMSEYFLQQTLQYYQQSVDEKVNNGMDKAYSLEKVFREMQEIVNAIYPPLFEMTKAEEDELVEIPLEEQLNRAKKRQSVLGTVAHLKEIDYKNTQKELDDTVVEIAKVQERIKTEAVRQAKLAQQQAEREARARQRAIERAEALNKRELERQKIAQEKQAEADRIRKIKEEEKQRAMETKSKLEKNRAALLAKAEAVRQKREAAKQKALEKQLAQQQAKEAAIQAKAEKAATKGVSAKDLFQRNRELIKQKAAAQKAKALGIDVEELESSTSGTNAGPDDREAQAKSVFLRNRELIKQKALEERKKKVSDEEDEDEGATVNKTEAKSAFQRNREAILAKIAAQKKAKAASASADDDEDEEIEASSAKLALAKKRELIRQKAMENDNADAPSKSEAKSAFQRNREAILAKIAAQKKSSSNEDDSDSKADAKSAFQRNREAILAKIAAQKAKAKKNDDEDDD